MPSDFAPYLAAAEGLVTWMIWGCLLIALLVLADELWHRHRSSHPKKGLSP